MPADPTTPSPPGVPDPESKPESKPESQPESQPGTPVLLPPGLRHDLLNALNAVLGYADLLRLDLTEGQHRTWIERLSTAAREAQAHAQRIPSSRRRRGTVLLVVDGVAGDALETGLDRQGWEPVRALDWTDAAEILADGLDDLDAILADGDPPAPLPPAAPPLVRLVPGEGAESIADRLTTARLAAARSGATQSDAGGPVGAGGPGGSGAEG
ncbi:MAG: hypothetical protein RLY86_809 [Pseudomonadota bacterium]